jgi:hypothetical protein
MGMRSTMYVTCSWVMPPSIGVSITAGAMQLTSTPHRETSLPIAFVIAITAALADE